MLNFSGGFGPDQVADTMQLGTSPQVLRNSAPIILFFAATNQAIK
jgi:hypothetical protein